MSHHKQPEHHVRPYKILAQTIGLLVCIFYFFFIAGEGVPAIQHGNTTALKAFLPFMMVPLIGYLLTYSKELLGCVIMALGAVVLFFHFYMNDEPKMALIFSIPILVTTGLFILHVNKRKQLVHKI